MEQRRYLLAQAPLASIPRIIAHPIYGSAYAYGKTGVAWGYVGSGQHVGRRRKLRSEWLVQCRRA